MRFKPDETDLGKLCMKNPCIGSLRISAKLAAAALLVGAVKVRRYDYLRNRIRQSNLHLGETCPYRMVNTTEARI
jgi:hypothetical protein